MCQMKAKHVQGREGLFAHRVDTQSELLHDRDDLEKKLSYERHGSSLRLTLPIHYDISSLKHSDDLMRLHTGLQNYALFQWVFNQVQSKLPSLHYFKGVQSQTVKKYQVIAD